jgi:hypothetical protein
MVSCQHCCWNECRATSAWRQSKSLFASLQEAAHAIAARDVASTCVLFAADGVNQRRDTNQSSGMMQRASM